MSAPGLLITLMSPDEIRAIIREELAAAQVCAEPEVGPVWLTEGQVSEHTGIPVEPLRSWRRNGIAKVLSFSKVGRLARYNIEPVDTAIKATRVEVTA